PSARPERSMASRADADGQRPLAGGALRLALAHRGGGRRTAAILLRRHSLVDDRRSRLVRSATLATGRGGLVPQGLRCPTGVAEPDHHAEIRRRQLYRRRLAQRPLPRLSRGWFHAVRLRR